MPHPVVLIAAIALLAQTAAQDPASLPSVAPTPVPAPRPSAAPAAAAPQADGVSSRRVLVTGDALTFEILEDKEIGLAAEPQLLKVQSDGNVIVPYLGPVAAAGKTLTQLQAEIRRRLEADFYQTATVRMSLNVRAGSLYVLGEVGSPGRREIPPDEVFTLTRAIASAGGIGKFGNERKVELRRKKPDGSVEVTIHDYKRILKERPQDDVELRHDDEIFVPSKLISF
jgi:protein involved in polysaccharide export with SLBB domain